MKKTLVNYRVEGLSANAINLYKFISILCHSASESDILFESRDIDLFCSMFSCTDSEYLKAYEELLIKDVIGDERGGCCITLHPNLVIFEEDMECEREDFDV